MKPARGPRQRLPQPATLRVMSSARRKRGGHLLLHVGDEGAAQLLREPIDERAKRTGLISLCHIELSEMPRWRRASGPNLYRRSARESRKKITCQKVP